MGSDPNHEEEFEGDLSPLTVLLFGISVSVAVFFAVKRILDASEAKKFRRRTREEEEALLAAQQQQQHRQVQPIANRDHLVEETKEEFTEEEEEMELDETNDEFNEQEGAEEGTDAAASMIDDRPRKLTKKEIHKIEKRRRKQEQQEAWRYRLERERQLRELREQEEREREEFERQQAEKLAAKYKKAPAPIIERAPESELDDFLESGPRFITQLILTSRFPRVAPEVLHEQVQQLINRKSKRSQYIQFSDGSVLRVDDAILDELAHSIRSHGFIDYETFTDLALA